MRPRTETELNNIGTVFKSLQQIYRGLEGWIKTKKQVENANTNKHDHIQTTIIRHKNYIVTGEYCATLTGLSGR